MAKVEQLYGKPWSEREYIITLHYYFQNRDMPRHAASPFILDLAKLLGRTPASIVMRMENFASIDPDASGARKGLGNGGPRCEEIFYDWYERPDHLASCAELLIREATPLPEFTLFDAPEPVALPKAFSRYELLDSVGQGGFGCVFSCVDIESGVQRAIKIIRAENQLDREALHRFSREIRILGSVRHPNVIRLHECNLESEEFFPAFVMDFANCSLTQHLESARKTGRERPRLIPDEARHIFRSVSSGVNTLHKANVIHRDINPNNVLLLPDGTWVLADFGLAKFIDSAATVSTFVTRTHAGWGTAYYAAPEQYRDFKRTDERTDIYALGMLLWELFTNAWPPPERDQTGLPGQLASIFIKATERDVSARYQSVDDLLLDFESALDRIAEGTVRGATA